MKTLRSLTGLSALLLVMVACSGGEPTPEPAPEPAAEPAPEPATPDDPGIDKTEEDTEHIKIPSVLETSKALEAAGVGTKLADIVPDHAFNLDGADPDRAAIRTGVTLADMLLTVKTAKKKALVGHLETVKKGMSQLDGGKDIDATLADIIERVKADSVNRDELLQEFDELSMAVIPELDFNGNSRIVPLIQAGSWLEAANLVATAVTESKALKDGEAGVADDLLKQPETVTYFIKYVKTDGAEKAPEQVTKQLEESLTSLKALSEKTEPLVEADLAEVSKVTKAVLALL